MAWTGSAAGSAIATLGTGPATGAVATGPGVEAVEAGIGIVSGSGTVRVLNGIAAAIIAPTPSTPAPTQSAGTSPWMYACGET